MKTKYTTCLVAAASAAFSLLALTACNSTRVDNTWTAPDVTKIHFNKIMVVATFPDGATRRAAEDALKAQITKAECITSYSLLGSETDLKDLAKVSATLKDAGVDGVVIMRPVSDRSEISYLPGTSYPVPYRTFRGYYSRFYALSPFYYEPERVTVDHVVEVETNIYEVAGERLIWSAATTSSNPGNLKQLIKDASDAICAELIRQKLIPKP